MLVGLQLLVLRRGAAVWYIGVSMGMYANYGCESCGWEFSTWGPREFFRREDGGREAYGHPLPSSDEARARGIHGFDAQRYCPDCETVVQVVVEELESPVYDPFTAWGDDGPRRRKVDPKCPSCGGTQLLSEMPVNPKLRCPKCHTGVLELTGGGFT